MKLAGLILLVVFSAIPAAAQADRGAITGSVMDASDALVAGAAVRARNPRTGVEWQGRSNAAGQFTLNGLPVGDYELAVEAPRFKQSRHASVRVEAGQTVRVDTRLEPGDVRESIVVTAAVSPLATESSATGTLLSRQRVIDLPLSFAGGRSPENFAYKLAPGVEGDNWTSRVTGSPAFSKDVLLDGASVTTYLAGHFGESSVSLEAIEEFRVETSGMAAEYGRTSGGIFNFVLKSGANQLHGSAMGQLRNEWMDANSFVNNAYGRPKERDRRHNYAFSLGGPVEIPRVYHGSNRTFFYAAYERYAEQNAGLGSPNRTVPLTEWWGGDMSRYLTTQVLGQDALGRNVYRGAIYDPATTRTVNGKVVRDPFFGNIIPASRISQVSRNLGQIMTADYAPQVKQADGQFAMINNSFFPVANTTRFDQKQLSVKLDHNLSARQRLSGSWAWVTRPRVLVDQGGVWNASLADGGPLSRARYQTVETHMARIAHDLTLSPGMLNHALVAFNRQINPGVSAHDSVDGAALLGLHGLAAQGNFPEIQFSGGDRVSLPTLGYTANGMLASNSYEASDTLAWSRGRHLWKFGADLRRNQLNIRDSAGPATFVFQAGLTGMPGFAQTGHPFASMLLGQVTSASVNVDTPVGSRFHYAALFAQDDFKVSRRLTLNFGLRWDYQPVQTEAAGRLSNFCTTCTDPESGLPGAMQYSGSGNGRTGTSGFTANRRTGFGPRAGLAWQAAPRVVLRAAYGIFYEARVPNDWSGVPYGQKMGFTQQNVVNDPGSNRAAFNWDQGYPGVVTAAKLDPSLANYIYGPVHWDPAGGRVPYVQQWNAGLQFALPRAIVAEVGYLGNKATGLYANSLENLNQIPAAALQLGDVLGQWVDSQDAIPQAAQALGARYPFGSRGDWIPVQQTLQPFPQVPYWNPIFAYNAPLGFSTYNALQVTVTRRAGAGLTWLADYTLSKTISNLDSSFNTWTNYGRPLDYYNLSLEKSVSPYDQTHVAKFALRYDLPLGRRGGRALRLLAGGWALQVMGRYASGYPLGFGGTWPANANFSTNRAVMQNPNGQSLYAGFNAAAFDVSTLATPGQAANRYVNTALIQDPKAYTLGNASLETPQIRGFGFANEDLGLQKVITVRERFHVQVRAEFLNVFNRHRFDGIDTNPAGPLFGQVTGLDAGLYRQTQIGARVDF